MSDRLPPRLVSKLDQLHAARVERFDSMLATPGLTDSIRLHGEAVFCADTANTLLDGIAADDGDPTEVAALLAIAIARLAKKGGAS